MWMAYQLDLPESGEGLVVALRRPESPYPAAELRLHGLQADAAYVVVDLDRQDEQRCLGEQLMDRGLRVTLTACPGSALLTYRRAR